VLVDELLAKEGQTLCDAADGTVALGGCEVEAALAATEPVKPHRSDPADAAQSYYTSGTIDDP
jgi:hypothetical protein